MTVIICPMCGRRIAGRVQECPGCGYSLGYMMVQEEAEIQMESKVQEETRTEFEKLVDEICARNDNMVVAIKELRQAAGMDLASAADVMKKRYKGVTGKEEKEASRRKRRVL